MRPDSGDIRPDKQTLLLQDLRAFLEKQIDLANQGGIKDVEAVCEQADSLVAKIARSRILQRPEFQTERRQLQKLYTDLFLALTAQKAETAKQLTLLHKGKKTLRVYRSNI